MSIKFWGFLLLVSLPQSLPLTLSQRQRSEIVCLSNHYHCTVPTACGLERQYKDKDVRHSDMLPTQKRGANGNEGCVSGLENPWRVVLHDEILIRASSWLGVAGILMETLCSEYTHLSENYDGNLITILGTSPILVYLFHNRLRFARISISLAVVAILAYICGWCSEYDIHLNIWRLVFM
jgi:hypothetical protein